LLALGAASAMAVEPAQVLDVVDAPAAWGWREISGLAWGPDGRTLYVVSDRGRLWRWTPRIEHAGSAVRLRVDAPPPPQRIDLPDGLRPNAEALAWVADHPAAPEGALLIADERAHQALLVSPHGALLATLPMPGVARGNNSGVEAMAWRPGRGLVAALQRPARGQAMHLLQGGNGAGQAFEPAAPRASLKALELVGDAFWVLEKLNEGHNTHRTLLRRLSAEGCAPPQTLCESARIELPKRSLQPQDNWEGLACRPDALCILAADSGGAPDGRTALMLLRLLR
jgi:hypothetical protein